MHNQNKFETRVKKHNRFQKEMQDRLRYLSKRKHTPDWVQAIGGRLVLLDTKTTPNVEDNSIHEYNRCVYEDAMPVVIIFMNWDNIHAEWFTNLKLDGPFPARANSTSGDDYYKILQPARTLEEFLASCVNEVKGESIKVRSMSKRYWDELML